MLRATAPAPALRAPTVFALLLLGLTMASCGSKDNEPPPVDAGASDTVPQLPFSASDLLDVCVRLGACGIQLQPRLGDCVKNFHNRLITYGQRRLWENLYYCANQGAGNCKTIRNCLGFAGRPTDPKLKCDSTYESRCSGDVAYKCDLILGWEQKLDCATGGLKCALKDTGSSKDAICGAGACDQKTYVSNCKENKLYTCTGGAVDINDCPEQGLQCRDSLAAVCEGKGWSCQTMDPVATCKGNTLVKCENDYFWETDCTKLFGKKKCDTTQMACIPAGTACSSDSFDTCDADGNTLVSCLDGELKRFDCKALGFINCKKASTGYGALCDAEPVYE